MYDFYGLAHRNLTCRTRMRHADHVQRVRRRLLVFLGRAASFDATLALSENTIFEVFEDFDLAPQFQLKICKLNEVF